MEVFSIVILFLAVIALPVSADVVGACGLSEPAQISPGIPGRRVGGGTR